MPEVNPFEPWRPRSGPDESPPPADEPPWRIPRDPEEEDEPHWSRRPAAAEPAWGPVQDRPRAGVAVFVWLTVGLIVAALVVWAVNGSTHVSRVASASAALWVGLLLAILVGASWRWYSRAAWVVSGLAGMALCWLLVPTTEGNSLLDAERVLARTRDLPPGDYGAFGSRAAERREIAEDFWRFRDDLRVAEVNWVRLTVEQEIQLADQERLVDPKEALARLNRVKTGLTTSEHYGAFVPQVSRARRRALESQTLALEAEVKALAAKKRHREAAEKARSALAQIDPEARELGIDQDLSERLREWRKGNVAAWARAAEAELRDLERAGKFVEVAAEGARLASELRPEAEQALEVNEGRELTVLAGLYASRKRALSARVRRANDELSALLKEKKYAEVPERARRFEVEFLHENAALADHVSLPGAFVAVRETALAARADALATTLKKLMLAKDYAAVATQGRDGVKDLDAEGETIGKRAWRTPIASLRREALTARLEQARATAREQLKKDEYRAMGETGEKTFDELSAEADAVGLRAEVEAFRASCRVFAKLGKGAGQ